MILLFALAALSATDLDKVLDAELGVANRAQLHELGITDSCKLAQADQEAAGDMRLILSKGRLVLLDPSIRHKNGDNPVYRLSPEEVKAVENRAILYENSANSYKISCFSPK